MELLAEPQIWIAFLTLTVLELALGIDNVIFISILSASLRLRKKAPPVELHNPYSPEDEAKEVES